MGTTSPGPCRGTEHAVLRLQVPVLRAWRGIAAAPRRASAGVPVLRHLFVAGRAAPRRHGEAADHGWVRDQGAAAVMHAVQQPQMGWICPQCRKGVNPSTPVCPCAGVGVNTGTTVAGCGPFGPPTASAVPNRWVVTHPDVAASAVAAPAYTFTATAKPGAHSGTVITGTVSTVPSPTFKS